MKNLEIKGYIFDYGATLDTGGNHWGQVLWHGYQRLALPVTEEQFREAYVHAERALGSNPIIQPRYTFRKTLDVKIRIEMDYLTEKGYWTADADEVKAKHDALLADLYEDVKRETDKSRSILSQLRSKYRMALVSNFYGNINVILKEFALSELFDAVIESAVVGIRKPDPRIFRMGVEALAMKPGETVVVGDSYKKDILPAHSLGCRTIWYKGETWEPENNDKSVPDKIITDLEQLL